MALLWAAVALYAASTVLFVATAVFHLRERWTDRAFVLATVGLAPHGISILLRWIEVGHGPYISFYEVASSDTWVAVSLYCFVAWRYSRLRLAGMAVLPVSFLLIGAAVFAPREGRELLPVLRSYWLVLHVTFAKLAYGPYLLGLGAAVLYLRGGTGSALSGRAQRLNDPAVLDELS
ncbi:MAG TPA: cytochrome c biogenesis protein CcsA, partial [Chloroflexota bacterium]